MPKPASHQYPDEMEYHIPTDMHIIANFRLKAIQEVGEAKNTRPYKVKPFKCGRRAYVLGSVHGDPDSDLILMILPHPDCTALDKLAFAIDGTPPYELFILENNQIVTFKELEPVALN